MQEIFKNPYMIVFLFHIDGMIFKRRIKLFLKYRIDESCTTLPKVGFAGLKWKIGYF